MGSLTTAGTADRLCFWGQKEGRRTCPRTARDVEKGGHRRLSVCAQFRGYTESLSTLGGEAETARRAPRNTRLPPFTALGVYFSLRRENQEGLELWA